MEKAQYLASLWLLIAASLVLAHPSHDSYAELDWNEDGTSLEISLRVVPEDLESALSEFSRSPVVLGTPGANDKLIAAYLAEHFRIYNEAETVFPVVLVGTEVSYEETWIYFTVSSDKRQNLLLQNTLILAQRPQQANRVRYLWAKGQPDQVFTRAHIRGRLPQKLIP